MGQFERVFPLVPGTKEPAVKGWNEIQSGKHEPNNCYGIALEEEALVLDVDPRNCPPGRNTIQEVFDGYPCPPTKVVATPGGGMHYYFTKPREVRVRKKQSAYPGIDFLSYGAFVVGPGSWTEQGSYTVVQDVPPAVIPPDLLASLEAYGERKGGEDVYSIESYQQFVQTCEVSPPGVAGSNGDETTYKLACKGRDFGLPKQLVYKAMAEHFNIRCVPPWTDQELQSKVDNAYEYAKNSVGCKAETLPFEPPKPKKITEPGDKEYQSIQEWQISRQKEIIQKPDFDIDKKGMPLPTLHNASLFLRGDPQWRGTLRYNMFSLKQEFATLPWWRQQQGNMTNELTKEDKDRIALWFSSRMQWDLPRNMLEAAIVTASTAYHPVRDYLDALEWDGVPRLDNMLIDTTGAADNIYTRAVGKNLLIAAVKRIYEPGCKHDYVPILESRQGTKKSTWIETLGEPWYSANDLVKNDKDTYQNLRGRWFVELPEIDGMFNTQDIRWLKGIITRSVDIYRASYGMYSSEVPRESVFVGSINPGLTGQYMSDIENRRYWPIKTTNFNIPKLRRYKNAYFAEAVARYKAGEDAYLTPEQEAFARREQDKRRHSDPWSDILVGWLANNSDRGFTTAEVTAALGINPAQFRRIHQDRLFRTMHESGLAYNRGRKKWELNSDWSNTL